MKKEKQFNVSAEYLQRSVFENAPDSIEILDINRKIIDCNKAREQLTGHARSELIGKHISDFFTTESKKKFTALPALEKSEIAEGEFEIISKEKRIIPIWRKTKALFDKENRLFGIISYTREIRNFNTRIQAEQFYRKMTEAQLTDKQKKYETLFEKSNDAIFILAEDMFIDCNRAAERIFAGSKEQILHASLVDFVPVYKKNKAAVVKMLEEKFAQTFEGNPQRFALELCRMDKKHIHTEISLSFFTVGKQPFLQAIIRDISEQYHYEKTLHKSQSLFKGVINASQNAIIGINQNGLCFLFNPAAEKMFLQKEKDMLGRTLKSIIPAKYKTGHHNGIRRIFKTGDFDRLSQKIYQVEGQRSDGSVFPLEFSFSFVSVNEEMFIIGFGQDITDRVLREGKLIESEKKFRQLFQDMPDAIFIISYDGSSRGRILDVNLAAERQSGYSRDELLQMNVLSDLCAGEINSEIIAKREEQLEKTGKVQFTERKIRKDGTEYWSDVILTKISYNGENTILAINRDVTEKIEAEEKILKLSSAFEQSPVFFMITDSQGKIEYANNQANEIIGYTQDELIGKYFRFENFPAFPKEEFKHLWNALKNGTYWRNEFKLVNNEKELFVSAGVFPIKNEQGKIINYLGVIEDRSEHKLLRDQLFQIQKMDSIGALTGGIAHDFNNLLTVINGYSELASHIIPKDEKSYKYIKSIFSAGEKASRLVSQLLAFSRQQVVDKKVVDLNTTIKELNKMITRLIGTDIHYETALEPDLPLIKADPVQLEQIIINLIVNARDALNDSGVATVDRRLKIDTKSIYMDTFIISNHSELEEGKYVLCTVSDSGSGMPKEVADRIFEPFFTTKEKGRGTGLGLATVYGIVKQNKGDIQVYSVPGKGTTFKIYWPVSDSLQMKKHFQEKIIEKSVANEQILLVDDDHEVRALAKELLVSLNYTVTEADSGKEALELLQKESCEPHLLVTDLVMSEMDGMELAQRVKKIKPEIKILYASGFADDRFFKRDREGIEKYFVQKPYTLYSMATKIREVLDSGSS